MMNNGMLSQDEIDALLRGNDDQDDSHLTEQSPSKEHLTPMEVDALGEIGNISFGSSATALSTLLNQKVEITTPTVSTVHKRHLADKFPHPHVAIQVSYTIGFLGANVLVIKQSDAAIIADLMLGGDGRNPQDLLGEIQLSAVQEAMNQMMGSAATSMSTIFNKKVDISPPSIEIMDLKEGEGDGALPHQDIFIQVAFRLKIGDLVDSNIMQLLPLEFGKSLVDELLNPSPPVAPKTEVKYEAPKEKVYDQQPMAENTRVAKGYSQPTSHEPQVHQPSTHQQQHIGASKQAGYQPTVQPAAFSNFEPSPVAGGESKNLDMLLDIPLQVTVELGRTKRSVRDILELSTGSIIELDKLAGEPVDILVNNRLVAKGEVVVIDENFGVRVTDIISQSDRIKNLR
jgi:flagellar motor switch protein FliN/FliY